MYTSFHKDPQKSGKQNVESTPKSQVKESASSSATDAQKRNDNYWRRNSVITRRTITLPQIIVDGPPAAPDLGQSFFLTPSQWEVIKKESAGSRLMPVALPKVHDQQDRVDACRNIKRAWEKQINPLLKIPKAKRTELEHKLKYSRMIIRSLHPGKSWENNWTYLLLLNESLQNCHQVYLLGQEIYKHVHDVCQLTRSPVKRVSVSAFELLEYISRMKIVRDHPETVPTCLEAIGSGLKWLKTPAFSCLKESVRSNDLAVVVAGLVKGCKSYNIIVRRTASHNLAYLVKRDCIPTDLRKVLFSTGEILCQDSDVSIRTNGDVIACVVGAANDAVKRDIGVVNLGFDKK